MQYNIIEMSDFVYIFKSTDKYEKNNLNQFYTDFDKIFSLLNILL